MNLRFLLLLGLLLTAAFVIPDSGKLVGVIIDEETGAALSSVEIVIENTQKKTVTDKQGRYYILDIPEGSYVITAKQEGYKTSRIESVKISSDYTTELNFKMESNSKTH